MFNLVTIFVILAITLTAAISNAESICPSLFGSKMSLRNQIDASSMSHDYGARSDFLFLAAMQAIDKMQRPEIIIGPEAEIIYAALFRFRGAFVRTAMDPFRRDFIPPEFISEGLSLLYEGNSVTELSNRLMQMVPYGRMNIVPVILRLLEGIIK